MQNRNKTCELLRCTANSGGVVKDSNRETNMTDRAAFSHRAGEHSMFVW